MGWCSASTISSSFDGRSAPLARPVGGDNLTGMEIDFEAFPDDPAYADEDPGLWQNMDVRRHPGAPWLITGRTIGRRQDANAVGAELARIWEEHLRYQYRAGHTIETTPDHVTLRAVTQIAPGGLWVTATVQVDLAQLPGICRDRRFGLSQVSWRRSVARQSPEDMWRKICHSDERSLVGTG